jgi:hypothetical protein
MQTTYTKYLRAQKPGKKFLLYDIGNDALALLKKQYINFGNRTIYSMILHLREMTAIKMTTFQSSSTRPRGMGSSGIQEPALRPTSLASTSFEPLSPTEAAQQASRK